MNKPIFFPSIIIVLSVLVSSAFFYWAFNAVYDIKRLEAQGHNAYAAKQYDKAYSAFTRAAQNTIKQGEVNNKNLSNLYRYAGSAAYKLKDYKSVLTMATMSLRYNPINIESAHLIKHMLHNKQITQQQIDQLKKTTKSSDMASKPLH